MSSYLFILSLCVFILLYVYSLKLIQRAFLLNKYKNVLDLFDLFLTRSYTWIYSDQIIGYTASGLTNIPEEEFETIEKNFIKLALDIMGPDNEKVFISFFGSRRIMMNNMILYIREKLAADQISSAVTSQKDNQ